jgi:endonuclease V-like protein UPF0215 family
MALEANHQENAKNKMSLKSQQVRLEILNPNDTTMIVIVISHHPRSQNINLNLRKSLPKFKKIKRKLRKLHNLANFVNTNRIHTIFIIVSLIQ